MKEVTVTVTNRKTGETYQASSYPGRDLDKDGFDELYRVPVYKVEIQSGKDIKHWTAVRFMPYWNDPSDPNPHYKTKGFVGAGIHKFPKQPASLYLPSYGTQNRYSPYSGAIQIRNSFLIHAGPKNLQESGWGSAGCVEIIGDFDNFKKDIRDLAGMSSTMEAGTAIFKLVQNRKLYIQVEYDTPPDFKKLLVD